VLCNCEGPPLRTRRLYVPLVAPQLKEQVVASQTMCLDCPAYLDKDCAARCGLPAEVEVRYTMASTDGPMESAKIRCPRGHWFNGLIESLTAPKQQAVAHNPERAACFSAAHAYLDAKTALARGREQEPALATV
jgi:hypothetical protein